MDGRMDSFIEGSRLLPYAFPSRHRNLHNQFVDHVVSAQSIRIGFVTQDEAVSQAVMDDGADIVGGNVVAPIELGACTRHLVEGQCATWAGTDVNTALQVCAKLLWAPRSGDERH